MKVPVLVFTLLINYLSCQDCPSPPFPLGTFYNPLTLSARGNATAVQYKCRGDLKGVGTSVNKCKDGKWEKPSFKCCTNSALNKPLLGSHNHSKLAVDGKYLPSSPHYFCNQMDNKNKVWGVDMLETITVIAVNISTHAHGTDVKAIEIRVGNKRFQ